MTIVRVGHLPSIGWLPTRRILALRKEWSLTLKTKSCLVVLSCGFGVIDMVMVRCDCGVVWVWSGCGHGAVVAWLWLVVVGRSLYVM